MRLSEKEIITIQSCLVMAQISKINYPTLLMRNMSVKQKKSSEEPESILHSLRNLSGLSKIMQIKYLAHCLSVNIQKMKIIKYREQLLLANTFIKLRNEI